jgi:hypothetical protein
VSRVASLFGLLIVSWVAACGEDPDIEREGGPIPSAGTSGSDSGSAGAGSLVPFCAALQVVRDKCQRCHADPPKNGAPVAFLTYDDFQRPYGAGGERKYWEASIKAVERDIMPYVILNEPPTSLMPPVEPLTASEKATLLGWLEQGATPEGGTDCP